MPPIYQTSTFAQISPPPVLRNLGDGFDQDSFLDVKSVEELALRGLAGVAPADAFALGQVLDDLLSGSYSLEEVQEIWHATPADIYFHDPEDTMKVLRAVREVIGSHPYFQVRE